MKKIVFIIICYFLTGYVSNAQIKFNAGVAGGSINGSSAFMDAQSPANATNNPWNDLAKNVGKGLAWPRTDLTQISSLVSTFIITNKYDGMIVYNTATGTSGIGSSFVTPGFYYYKNTTNNVNGGTWVRLNDSNDATTGASVYYGVLTTTTPSATDIQGLATKTLGSGSYDGSFDQATASAGYFTVAIPVSWRNPTLKIGGNDTWNVLNATLEVTINNVKYQVWQTDVSLPSGQTVVVK